MNQAKKTEDIEYLLLGLYDYDNYSRFVGRIETSVSCYESISGENCLILIQNDYIKWFIVILI